MSFINISAKLIGKPDISGWSQIHNFKPPEEKEAYGELFILLSVINQDEARNVTELGKNITSALYEDYFSTEDKHKRLVLESILKDNIKRFSIPNQQINAAVCVLIDKILYCAVYGKIKLYLYRREKTNLLLKGQNNIYHTLSGNLANEDMVVIGTEETFSFLPEGSLDSAVTTESSDKAVEILAPLIHSHTNTGSFGMLFIKLVENIKVRHTEAADYIPKYPTFKEFQQKEPLKNYEKIKDLVKPGIGFLHNLTVRNRAGELPANNKKKRNLAFLGIFLLLVLVISTIVGTVQKQQLKEKSTLNAKLTEAEHLLNESFDLASLDSLQAKKLFDQGRSIVNEIQNKEIKNPKIEELQKKIDANEGIILGERTVNPLTFVDLSLLSSGFSGDSLVTSGGSIYIFDKQGKKIAEIVMQTKHAEIVAGPQQILNGEHLIVYANQIYLGAKDGIYKLNKQETKIISESWNNSVLAQGYAGNIYLVNKDINVIQKYIGGTSGNFSTAQKWLTEESDDNLSEATSLAIDGSLWILTRQGKILRYNQGNRQRFVINGMTSGFNEPKMLYTAEGFKNLYILDQNNSRIVVIDKSGDFVMEYSSDVFSKGVGIAANEEQKRIYIMTGDKLMYIEAEE